MVRGPDRSGHPHLKWLWGADWGRAACGGNPYLPGIRSKVNDREMDQPSPVSQRAGSFS